MQEIRGREGIEGKGIERILLFVGDDNFEAEYVKRYRYWCSVEGKEEATWKWGDRHLIFSLKKGNRILPVKL